MSILVPYNEVSTSLVTRACTVLVQDHVNYEYSNYFTTVQVVQELVLQKLPVPCSTFK